MLWDCEGFVLYYGMLGSLSNYLKKKKTRNVEYNIKYNGESGEDGSVEPNNGSMIKMLTLTMNTKFLYACCMDHHRMHVCVGLSPPPPPNYIYLLLFFSPLINSYICILLYTSFMYIYKKLLGFFRE